MSRDINKEDKEALSEFVEILKEECGKHGLDPTEEDINPDYHVELTISVGELRKFIGLVDELS